ncbi:MAG: methylmalonyl Co-A mutase-associated GTPase MeaB [bacterium]
MALIPPALQSLWEAARTGDHRALGRLCSVVEAGESDAQALLDAIDPLGGKAIRIGVTGPPGSGKSSLIQYMIAHYRQDSGDRLRVVAVDPTSPRSGGALLGDRIRWSTHQTDPRVFIRSMGSRGSLGGVAQTTRDLVSLFDAAGCDRILIETVGTGQVGSDIAQLVDVLIVLLVPESGDAVQMLKAGILELADLYIVNKADRPGAESLADHLAGALEIAATVQSDAKRIPPILQMSTSTGEGVHKLWMAIDGFVAAQRGYKTFESRRRLQRQQAAEAIVRARLIARTHQEFALRGALADTLDQLATRTISPQAVAQIMLERLGLPE